MKRIYLPFDTPVFRPLNPNHPLTTSLVDRSYDDFYFVRARQGLVEGTTPAQTLRHAASFSEQLQAGRIDIPCSDENQMEFIKSRDLLSQTAYDTSADLAYLHTAPMTINQMPYVLHFESLTTLFHPFLAHGETKDLRLRDQHVFWFVRTMLESELCRGIFTNLTSSVTHMKKAFASDVIARKLRHVPPGPYFTPEQNERMEVCIAQKCSKNDVNILFTNSWHQDPRNFFLRGGAELILAFLQVEQSFPNVRLTLRATVPPQVDQLVPNLFETVHAHPKIRVISEKVSEEELFDLLLDTDIFFLNAAGIHSISVLRAMYCGAVCVVSDLIGYDDYLTHAESGIVLTGVKDVVCSEEPETGWLREDYRPMYQPTKKRVQLITHKLNLLCEDKDLRLSIGMKARQRMMAKNTFSAWRNGFESVMRDALGLAT